MRRLIFLALICITFMPLRAADPLLLRLDTLVTSIPKLRHDKELRIQMLRNDLKHTRDTTMMIATCINLYEEYEVYQFDSAFAYIERAMSLAVADNDRRHLHMCHVMKAKLLAIGGLYPESVAELNATDVSLLPPALRFAHQVSYFYTYLYWSDYCSDPVYAPHYRQMAIDHLRAAMPLLDRSWPESEYYLGEYYVFVEPNQTKARAHYLKALTLIDEGNRMYAQAANALSGNYADAGDSENYARYLALSAISDLVSCTRDNMALPNLAMHLYGQPDADVRRAEQYINTAMAEAKLYNNRLRLLEISQKLPVIVEAYKATVTRQNTVLRIVTFAALALMIAAMVLLYFYTRQNRQLSAKRHELSASNTQLTTLNTQLTSLNGRLHTLNEQLLSTNVRRERLAKLYIDLCANFIDRLSRFELLVRRKIKAGQINDLLSMASSSKLSEQDAATFLVSFDKAFLDLYPSFVDELNALLRPECRITGLSHRQLTTELRILALIRLGVKESSEIAALLFYTPRTIYNYRSTIKARAICRDTFEDDVAKLCTVI